MPIGDGVLTCLVCNAPLDADGVNCTRINAPFHDDTQSDYGPITPADEVPTDIEPEKESGIEAEGCYLCGGPLVDGNCIAYHWNDAIHLRNRTLLDPESEWRQKFHTKQECENAPPIRFLIDGFLQADGCTAIAAPVRERKSLIALNVAHALLTGEKLFGHFEVTKKPDRVLYLCPEVSLGPFTERVKKIGLLDFVGDRFFYRTMNSSSPMNLEDKTFRAAIPGSVIFLDTAIRFLKGDENSSTDVRAFADNIFALIKHGAEAVVLLHHSPKDMGDSMTLESAMRGSGDLGAFLQSCWGTRLQDPGHPYESPSYLKNLKQRDFQSEPFEVTCGEDCRMQIVKPAALTVPVALTPRKRFKGNQDGRDPEVLQFLSDNPKLSERDTIRQLKDLGIKRGRDWIREKRYELLQQRGGRLAETTS